ncbi:hypothetical protein DL768_002648 [Monosporascus sp. mg162]|nr:hypothetical protein DL768_002648 [Monosporascus sp. mg162]
MASHFQIQKSYVLTSLPRPLDPTTGRYVVNEVYGTTPGSKKRKRTELTVGTDGDSVNIYEVSSARLVTSYPIPPQSSFTCPASSIRRRNTETKEVARYTYVSTYEHPAYKVTLFKDLVTASGETISKTDSITLGPGQPVTYLAPIKPLRNEPSAADSALREELIVARADGEIISLDVETLQKKWASPPKVLHKGVIDNSFGARGTPLTNDVFKVEFCCSALVCDIVQGIFKGNEELISLFPGEILGNKTDSEVLLLISSVDAGDEKVHSLHIVGISPQGVSLTGPRLALLYTGRLPMRPRRTGALSYHLDAQSGTLLELDGQTLTTYDLASGVPRISATLLLEEASSFLRLSKTSLLSSSGNRLNVYNPIYQSLQSSATMMLEGQPPAAVGSDIPSSRCQLAAYFPRLELAIAIVNSNLVAIQLEAPKTRAKKRRAEGLLIDSIGRGVPSLDRGQSTVVKEPPSKSVFTHYLPGSIRGDYWQRWTAEESLADGFLNSNDVRGLERFLAEKFGVETSEEKPAQGQDTDEVDVDTLESVFRWNFPQNRTAYAYADRRWVLYAISRVFEWNDAGSHDEDIPRLVCQLPQSNIVNYLVDAGHLTLPNIKSAFKSKLNETEKADSFVAEQLITRLADLDPSLTLLGSYISATSLGSTELLLAVRTIMRNLGLVQDRSQNPPKLITNGSSEDADNGVIDMELDNLEEQIQKAESYLSGNAGGRGVALSAAFAKLGSCPSSSMVKALRSTFKPEEILSFVHILRVELVKGAWTSRYLDTTDFEQDPKLDAPPDGIIKLLADLLGRCVDAIGPSGWLVNDAILANDESGDFIASLKLEVSAALEGIEEAVYLRGIVGEAVKYCQTAEKQARSDAAVNKMKPIPLHVGEIGAEALPLGLKSKKERISPQKVVSGGEIVDRSARETGHLRSQQVGAYSLERIAI